jgi:hypothetical protein
VNVETKMKVAKKEKKQNESKGVSDNIVTETVEENEAWSCVQGCSCELRYTSRSLPLYLVSSFAA